VLRKSRGGLLVEDVVHGAVEARRRDRCQRDHRVPKVSMPDLVGVGASAEERCGGIAGASGELGIGVGEFSEEYLLASPTPSKWTKSLIVQVKSLSTILHHA
jgi:hypothetical protein